MVDAASNASSTDEYIRELLDPDDRPKNVWHVVEGPKADDQKHGDQHQNSEQDDQYDDERRNNDTKHVSHKRHYDEEVHSPTGHRRKKLENHHEEHDRESEYIGDVKPKKREDSYDEKDHRYRDSQRTLSRHKHQRYPSPTNRRAGSVQRSRSRSRSGSLTRRHRSSSKSPSHSRTDYQTSSRSRSRRSGRRRSRRHRSRSRSRSPRRSRHTRDRSNSQSPLTKRNSRTIFLMQLSPRTTSRDLDDFFSPIGRVREVRLIMDSKTRKHKGIAYIEFEDASSVEKAFSLNGKKLHGIPILIQTSQADRNHHSYLGSSDQTSSMFSQSYPNSRSTLPPNSLRVYVGGLNTNLTEEMLRSLFEPFGDLLRIELMRDHLTGQSRGYAFITFANIDEAQEAIQGLNGLELGGKALKVSKSTERGVRN